MENRRRNRSITNGKGTQNMTAKRAICALTLCAAASPSFALVNIVAAHWTSVVFDGISGVLRAGSIWEPSPSSELAPVDGIFQPENTQWNRGSFWWDQDPSVNASPLNLTITLDATYSFGRFVVQADDNDSYLLEYWDGAGWQDAYAIPAVFSFGLVTRDSGSLTGITTDRLRFRATGGDNWYSVSEIQAYAVPEPATWAMMILGFGIIGAAMRRARVKFI